jgi:hypothetical protein
MIEDQPAAAVLARQSPASLDSMARVSPGGVAGMACLLRDGFQGNLDAFGEETIMSTPIPIGREAAEDPREQSHASWAPTWPSLDGTAGARKTRWR